MNSTSFVCPIEQVVRGVVRSLIYDRFISPGVSTAFPTISPTFSASPREVLSFSNYYVIISRLSKSDLAYCRSLTTYQVNRSPRFVSSACIIASIAYVGCSVLYLILCHICFSSNCPSCSFRDDSALRLLEEEELLVSVSDLSSVARAVVDHVEKINNEHDDRLCRSPN